MTTSFKIVQITPSGAAPGSIEIQGVNLTDRLLGRYFLNEATSAILPDWTASSTVGYTRIVATTFEVYGNERYNGRYTVYTPTSAVDFASSTFASGNTTANVATVIPPLEVGDPGTLLSDGYVFNISTFVITVGGGSNIILPPGITKIVGGVELVGHGTRAWGEGYAQNTVDLTQQFASATAPIAPILGQLWYDVGVSLTKVWNGSSWVQVGGAGSTFKHTQAATATTWTINHNLGLALPFIAIVQFFVDDGMGPKLFVPSDITFNSANQLTATFATAKSGWALVKP